ncbi:MAG: hypothetical protein J7J52_04590 [Deltaproteobacteria bacterium]|nr:hypothetical protein [Deltaproteobacteria bacterium]
MKKMVDIDALLGENKLVLKLSGKEYEVKDIGLDVFLKALKVDENAGFEVFHKQLACILGVDQEELKGIGLKAASLAMSEIRNWILDVGGAEAGGNP